MSFDWKYFLKELLLDNETKMALGTILGGLVMLIPGMTIEYRLAIVALIFGVLKLLAGAQSAKVEYDFEMEYRTRRANDEAPHG